MSNKNRAKTWQYGYNSKYDIIIISTSGELGEVINVSGINIGLPLVPKDIYKEEKKEAQYWKRTPLPKPLSRIASIFQWNEMPAVFKDRWIDYIEAEFDQREHGHWFMNNGIPTYMTGAHYMYLQWATIDVGFPDFREANRIFFIYWEACKADTRCFGMSYLKIRRSGFSFMGSSECVNTGTLANDARVGILSKTGSDAKKMFTDKVVPIANRLPFFFKPIQDGMDKPKTELAFRIPASKITKKNMHLLSIDELDGLDTTIDWKNTDDNSYDGEKLLLLVHDESGKWIKPNNILNNGGDNFKKLYEDSNAKNRNGNGQTKSGLYSLFIPMEYNMEGFIDRFGEPVVDKPTKPIKGIDDIMIESGALTYWEAEVESLKNDPDALNEFYRHYKIE